MPCWSNYLGYCLSLRSPAASLSFLLWSRPAGRSVTGTQANSCIYVSFENSYIVAIWLSVLVITYQLAALAQPSNKPPWPQHRVGVLMICNRRNSVFVSREDAEFDKTLADQSAAWDTSSVGDSPTCRCRCRCRCRRRYRRLRFFTESSSLFVAEAAAVVTGVLNVSV